MNIVSSVLEQIQSFNSGITNALKGGETCECHAEEAEFSKEVDGKDEKGSLRIRQGTEGSWEVLGGGSNNGESSNMKSLSNNASAN